MELTPRAIGLRDSLAEALHRVQEILVADSFASAKSSRGFSVMMHDHIAHLIVPALVKRLRADAPGVKLQILPWESPASMRPERFRSIDLLISCTTNEIPGFEREILFTDTEATVIRSGHPAAARMRQLKIFLKCGHVAVVGRGVTEDPVDAWLRQEGLTREVVLRVPSYSEALQVAAQSELAAFVPKLPQTARKGKRSRSATIKSAISTIHLLSPEDEKHSPLEVSPFQ